MANKNNIDIIISATDNASKTIKQTQKSITNLGEKTNTLGKVREENKGKITAAAGVAFAGLSYYLKQGIDDVNAYNYSIKRLEALTKNSTGATKEQVNALVKQAENLEKVGVATKDNILAGMSQFATFDLSTEAISKLTNAYVDYVVAEKGATASSEEYKAMANSLAQALQGNYISLTRTGFILSEETKQLIENGDEMQKVSAIVDVLNTTYKDFNKTAAETAEGKSILIQRSLNDIRETIAKNMLPIIEKVTEIISNLVTKLNDRVQENPKLATAILGITTALAGLITIIGAVSLALPAITTAISILSGPIGIVIAALTTLGVAYTTNFGGFRDFLNEIWQEISPLLNELAQAFIECFGEIRKTIKEVYQKLEPLLIPLWNFFKEAVITSLKIIVETVVISFKNISETIKSITQTLTEVINFITNIFSGNWQAAFQNLQNIVQIRKDTVITIFSNFGIDLPAIFETLKTTINTIRNSLFDGLKNICSGAVDRISDKVSSVWDSIQAAKDAISGLWGGGSSGGRASGGIVLAGQTYRVNEIHSEYFTPAVNGKISQIPQNTTPNLNINFNGNIAVRNDEDFEIIKSTVKEVIMESYKNLSMGYS